jgi:phosphoglycerol transferase MdoB-like AlkP superfamily enzyme
LVKYSKHSLDLSTNSEFIETSSMTRRLPLLIGYSFLFLIVFSMFRVLFVFKYSYRMENFLLLDVIHGLLIGLRFDFATLGMILGGFWILSSFQFLNRFRIFVILWSYLPILLFIWIIGHLVGDLIYFENANKHIGYEGFVFIGKDLINIIISFAKNDLLTFTLAIFGILSYAISSFILYRKFFHFKFTSEKIWISFRNIAFSTLLVVILIRGGIQESPIRASDSIISDDGFVNNIALNGLFTSIMDLKSQKIPKSLLMDSNYALAVVRKEIDYPGAEWINHPKYPILRKTLPSNNSKILGLKSEKPPNIVLILLESWTGKFTQPVSNGLIHGKELTPYFNALSKKGRSYKKFFANGGRTTNGLLSILTGIPDRPGLTAVRTHQILSQFSSIGNITKQLGYKTIFITGDDLAFDNVKVIMPKWGFDTIRGKDYMASTGKYKIGAWGYDDLDILDVLEKEINSTKENQPFLGVALTMSTHYPYKVPKKEFEIFSKEIQDYDYLNTYHYADWALHQFMESMKKNPRFNNTIFIFVGDHTHHRYLNYYEDRNIPFLIYAPDFIKPYVDEKIASQLDIIPTILGFINKEIYFSAMGRDLLNSSIHQHSAYFAYGSTFGWIEDNLFFFQYTDGPQNLKLNTNEPWGENEKCISDPIPCKLSEIKAKAFFNLGMELLNKDKIFPKTIP